MPALCLTIFLLLCPCLANAQDSSDVLPLGESEILSLVDARVTMPESLMPGLARHPELKPLFEHGPLPAVAKTYLLKRDGHTILFDNGWGAEQAKKGATLELLAEKGIKPQDITDIILTHMDIDHIGGLIKNDRPVFPNATIWVSKPEYEAWASGAIPSRPQLTKDLAARVIAAYKDRIRTFAFGDEILPGILAIDARGHTPGHTAYEVRDGDAKLYILGDLIHIGQIQFAHPELSTNYDVDPVQAAQSRERILGMIAETGAQAAGMHFEMVSPVRKRSDGGYAIREPR